MGEEAVTTIIITIIIHRRLIIDHHLQLDHRHIFEIIFEEEEVVEDDLAAAEEAVIVIDTIIIIRVDLHRFIAIFAMNPKFTETLPLAAIVVHLHLSATEKRHLEVRALEVICVMVQVGETDLSVMELLEAETDLSVTGLINIMGEKVAHPLAGVVSHLVQ